MNDGTETAILAAGCYWMVQQLVRHLDGIVSTRVGYIGGEHENPTNDNHPGHAEAVEIVFDPDRISYRDLLEYFFQIGRPDLDESIVGSRYRSEIFYTTEEQRRIAEETVADVKASGLWPKVVTALSEAGPFWESEVPEDQDYLQRYPEGRTIYFPRRELETANRETAG